MPNLWKIVGGEDKGGILVREGRDLNSPQLPERLSTGAEVEELELLAGRLRFRRRTGAGPIEGWISVKLSNKVLAEGPFDDPSGSALAGASKAAPSPSAASEPAAVPATAMLRAGNEGGAGDAELPWVEESRKKMQAFRDGSKVLPTPIDEALLPQRLRTVHPRTMLPEFKKLSPKQMEEMSVKNLPGHFSGLRFPHNTEQLKSFGPTWYTEAFHKFGTLPKDNRVTKIVSVEQLPHSGFDAAGGAGHKAFITLEYARPDPTLHTQLFAKFPWDYFESLTGKTYRMQLSTYADMDSAELLTSMCCEHLFPFRIPKLYFCDINRDTTNYMLIVERIPFGRRGQIRDGRVVEKIERKPYEILPVCGKYQDYLLEDPAKIYFCLFRTMAHLAAWDQMGRYDDFLGAMPKYTSEGFLQFSGQRKAARKQLAQNAAKAAELLVNQAEDFAMNIAPQIFPPATRDPKMLAQMKQDLMATAPHFKDVSEAYTVSSSDWIAAAHMNLQPDNAYFWQDEHGDLDGGVFDWCGFARGPFVTSFFGCLMGADADILDAHEEGLMKLFCDEYERYGGPHLEWTELLLRYHLLWPSIALDACKWVDRDILRECPKEEWSTVQDKFDDKFVGRWNVRTRATTLVNTFQFWPRRNFRKIFEDWMSGAGKPYVTPYTL